MRGKVAQWLNISYQEGELSSVQGLIFWKFLVSKAKQSGRILLITQRGSRAFVGLLDLPVDLQSLPLKQPKRPMVPSMTDKLSIPTQFCLLIGHHTLAAYVIESLARKIVDEKRATKQSVLGTTEKAQILHASIITLIKTCQVLGLQTPALSDQQEPDRIFIVVNGDRSIQIIVASLGFSHRVGNFQNSVIVDPSSSSTLRNGEAPSVLAHAQSPIHSNTQVPLHFGKQISASFAFAPRVAQSH